MARIFSLKPNHKKFQVDFLIDFLVDFPVDFLELRRSTFSIYNSKNLKTELHSLIKTCGLVLRVSKANNHFLSSTSNKTVQTKKIPVVHYVSPLSIPNNNNLPSFN